MTFVTRVEATSIGATVLVSSAVVVACRWLPMWWLVCGLSSLAWRLWEPLPRTAMTSILTRLTVAWSLPAVACVCACCLILLDSLVLWPRFLMLAVFRAVRGVL